MQRPRYDADARLAGLLDTIGPIPHRWEGMRAALDALLNEETLGDRVYQERLTSFIHTFVEVFDDRIHTMQEAISQIERERGEHLRATRRAA